MTPKLVLRSSATGRGAPGSNSNRFLCGLLLWLAAVACCRLGHVELSQLR